MAEEVLLADPLCSGDRPSVLAAGMTLAHALRKGKVAVFMVDALGQVVLMPPDSVAVLRHPFVTDQDLDAMGEDEAIALMVSEERRDEDIVKYLAGRSSRGLGNG
jgi:hypothetical protein